MILHIGLLNKDLLLTPHAYERMVERGVSLEELIAVLESKDSYAFVQRNGRIRIGNNRLEIILQPSGSVLYLVTVVRKEKS